MGAISIPSCIYAYFTAMHKTQKRLHTEGNSSVTQDEFDYYDGIRNVCVVGFIWSLAVLKMGKKGLRSIKMGTERRPWAKPFRRSVWALVIIMIMTMVATHICHGLHKIGVKYNPHDKRPNHNKHHDKKDSHGPKHGDHHRHL
jgi:hypothetical protein